MSSSTKDTAQNELEIKYEKIENAVLKEITVDDEKHEQIRELLSILKEKIMLDLSSLRIPARVEIQGSFVKKTYLVHDDSFDLLLILPREEKVNIHRILDSLVARLKKDRIKKGPINVEKITGKNPYIRIMVEAELVHLFVGFEIIPGEPKISLFDLAPHHTQYILTHLEKNKRKDVLLFKKFLKNLGVYSSEIGAPGFNGYLCEILILFYGDFRTTLRALTKWEPRTIVDVKKNKEIVEDVDELTVALLTRYYPLYVPDPLNPRENVAATVSNDQFKSIIAAANLYLMEPSEKYFIEQILKVEAFEEIERKSHLAGRTVVTMAIERNFQEPEVCWQKSLALKKAFEEELRRNSYIVDRVKSYVTAEHYGILISMLNPQPHMSLRKEGPEVTSEASMDFLKQYTAHSDVIAGPFIDNHKWVVYFANKGSHVLDFLHDLVKENTYLLNVDSFLKMEIIDKLKIATFESGLKEIYDYDFDFAKELAHFVDRKPFWITSVITELD